MVLIVGLGNPGAKYARTRHNVGFDVVEILAARNQIELNRTRCKAKVGEGRIGNVRVALAQPQTYMNLSGEAVTQLVNWYKVAPEELLVVYDDVDLPFGRVRIRPKGSAGTHNGMRNILYLLGRDDFPRLRVGIGRPPEHWDMKDFVISGYETAQDRKIAFQAYLFAAECVETFVKEGFARAQQFASTQPSDFGSREES
ncbi:MAG TPA: aminoacyl-tRNA hydrolase [Candidatus Ornithocaccomicrobium faecavium]|uniref:Peptidyl-tRNA hydrolase n=1 Tax=Candidatus Ornithocaccomicrobium faecavium TaxID=2840890 RepID=A0A9D1TCQ6_9FIRM|nr:aminoacyl-tRNA hydrolase [Candidatus Ornithocaccomicrobium faecavium]